MSDLGFVVTQSSRHQGAAVFSDSGERRCMAFNDAHHPTTTVGKCEPPLGYRAIHANQASLSALRAGLDPRVSLQGRWDTLLAVHRVRFAVVAGRSG